MKQKLLLVLFCCLWPVMAWSAPVDFTFAGLDGKIVTAAELRGRVVVLNFATHWCPRCKAEAPALEQAYQAYKERGVVFLNLFVMSEVDDIKAFVKEYKLTFPVGRDAGMAEQFRIKGVPITLFIDKSGQVRQRHLDKISFEELQAGIEELLK